MSYSDTQQYELQQKINQSIPKITYGMKPIFTESKIFKIKCTLL